MDYSILNSYKHILDKATAIVCFVYPNQPGVFVYDKKSHLIFEFPCVADAMEANTEHNFVIYSGEDKGEIYIYNKNTEEYEAGNVNISSDLFFTMYNHA